MEYGYGYLIHSAKGSTWSKKDHKYISKEKDKNKWRYIYKIAQKAADDATKEAISKKLKEREMNYRINSKKAAADAINKNRFDKKVKEITNYNKALVSKQNQIVKENNNRKYKNREESARIQGTTFQKSLIKNPIKLTAQQRRFKEREMDYRINGRKKLEDAVYNKNKAKTSLPEELKDYPFKYKTKKTSKDEDMRIISQNYYRTNMKNPAWKEDSYAYSHNCAASSLAYYMRRKGFDVLPNRADMYDRYALKTLKENNQNKKSGATTDEVINWHKDLMKDLNPVNGTIQNTSNASVFSRNWKEDSSVNKRTADEIKKDYCVDTIQNFDGDIGFAILTWKNGGGHAIIWEKEDNDVIFRDCQVGKVMKNDQIRDYTDQALDVVLIDPTDYKLDPSVIYWLKNEGK